MDNHYTYKFQFPLNNLFIKIYIIIGNCNFKFKFSHQLSDISTGVLILSTRKFSGGITEKKTFYNFFVDLISLAKKKGPYFIYGKFDRKRIFSLMAKSCAGCV
jgi:hypothetical protein